MGFGWCQTIDAIQGVTSAEHINALPRGTAALSKFRGYTAESRAEWWTWTLIGEAAMREAVQHRRALGDKAPITEDELWRQAGKDLSRAPYKPLGMDLLAALQGQEQEAQTRFMAAAQRVQAQAAAGRRHGAEYVALSQSNAMRGPLQAGASELAMTMQLAATDLAPALSQPIVEQALILGDHAAPAPNPVF